MRRDFLIENSIFVVGSTYFADIDGVTFLLGVSREEAEQLRQGSITQPWSIHQFPRSVQEGGRDCWKLYEVMEWAHKRELEIIGRCFTAIRIAATHAAKMNVESPAAEAFPR